MKKVRWLGLISILLMALALSGCSYLKKLGLLEDKSVKAYKDLSISNMEVHFIDVGQGDCTLIICDGHAMLIDAGDNSRGTAVQNYIQKQGITRLDYAIGTHPDVDHIGGLDVVIYKFTTDTVILPDYEKDTITYGALMNVIHRRNYKVTRPVVGEIFNLGSAVFTIIGPGNENHSKINDHSVGIVLQHGENRFVFIGDAEEAEEMDMVETGMNLTADVLKIPHHGSKNGLVEPFLEAVKPTYGIISCGDNNDYGHPHAKALNMLRKADVKVFRTDEQGTIVARSDGEKILWNASPSESWQTGEPKGSAKSTTKITEAKYIINSNTMKFHKPSCASVQEIAKKNKKESALSKAKLIKKGYAPCKKCLGE